MWICTSMAYMYLNNVYIINGIAIYQIFSITFVKSQYFDIPESTKCLIQN